MKRKLLFFTAVAAASILVSCEGVDSIGEEILLIPVKNGEEFQYIDKDGKIVINPQFKTATVFREGLALVETSGDNPQFGFINEDGKYVINAQYNQATIFSEGLAWIVSENSAPTAIDTEGQLKFTLQDAEKVKIFKEGLAAFSIVNEEGEEKWGFVDKTGKTVINPQFSEVSNFSNEKCAVRNDDGKWGFIDKEGGIVINPQFDAATDFNKGKCVVTYSDKQGVIDIEGKYIINPQFSTMRIDGDLYLVNQDGKFGWCDNDGKLIINPQFSEAFPFLGNELTSVKSGESYGYIDKEGKYIINPQFELALPFDGSLALVTSAGKVGFIDVEGKYVINPQFDDVSLDFIVYKLTGESVFNTVSTDYFNLGAITSIINFDYPEGFTFNSTFEDIMNNYGLSESDFSKYRTEYQVQSSKKITNDADYNFYVLGSPYETYTDNSGWYPELKYAFNPELSPTGYAYVISLKEKGYDKGEAILAALQDKLIGWDREENFAYYYDDKREITMTLDDDLLKIVINEYYLEEEYYEEEGDAGLY